MRIPRRVLCLALLPAAPVAAQRVHYEGSLSANTGRYIFTERTTSVWWTTGVAVRVRNVTVRGSIPVIWQSNTLITASGAGPIPSGGGGERSRAVRDSGAARRRRASGSGGDGRGSGAESGWNLALLGAPPVPVDVERTGRMVVGDPTLGATIRMGDQSRIGLGLGMTVKIPAADTASFGTGRWDIGGMASVTLRADDRTVIGIDGSLWHLGDLAVLDFRDPVTGSISISRLVGSNATATVYATAGSTALDGFAGPANAGLSLARLGHRATMALTLTVGLSETSPAVTGGLTWRIGL